VDTEMRKLQGNNQGTYMITLPHRFVKTLDLHKSDMIRLDLNGNKQIVMEKVNLQ
jgi:antitoxin component of MazEF toxin-antitoxin module